MNWYNTLINLLVLLFIPIMIWRMVWRGRFFLHVFQLSGYKSGEYWKWLKDHWSDYVITYEHGLINLLLLILFIFFRERITESSVTIGIFIYAVFWMLPVRPYRRKQKKPLAFTPRMLRLTGIFLVLAVLLPAWGSLVTIRESVINYDIYVLAFSWVLGDVILPFLLLAASWIILPLEKIFQMKFKRMARNKLAAMDDLTVIAITGSYGKTSTKFMIRDLLKERFSVCATPGSYNTPMGVCKVINNDLSPSNQVLVLEMGARYKGNIRELCRIARPDISIVTNVGVAHLETFGSKKAIRDTKAEIIENLNKNGTAILNADDEMVMEMEKKRNDIHVITAGLNHGDIKASNISNTKDGCRFTVHLPDGQKDTVIMPLLGIHNVMNMLLAIGVGHKMGLRLKTMVLAAAKMKPVEHRLELKQQGGVTVIDDAFNANPVGAANAVEVLSRFNGGRRIIITPGMVELGEAEEDENRNFGRVIGNAGLDMVLLVGPEHTKPIHEGIRETGLDPDRVKVFKSLFDANDFLKEYLRDGDVVLYENDLPDTYNE